PRSTLLPYTTLFRSPSGLRGSTTDHRITENPDYTLHKNLHSTAVLHAAVSRTLRVAVGRGGPAHGAWSVRVSQRLRVRKAVTSSRSWYRCLMRRSYGPTLASRLRISSRHCSTASTRRFIGSLRLKIVYRQCPVPIHSAI